MDNKSIEEMFSRNFIESSPDIDVIDLKPNRHNQTEEMVIDEDSVAFDAFKQIRVKQEEAISEEERTILSDMRYLFKFSYSFSYLNHYSLAEVHSIAESLRSVTNPNPDTEVFMNLRKSIFDDLIKNEALPKYLNSQIPKLEEDQNIDFNELDRLASLANTFLDKTIKLDPKLKDYTFTLRQPDHLSGEREISNVLQYIANKFIMTKSKI